MDHRQVDHRILLIVDPSDPSIAEHGPIVDRFRSYGIRVECLNEPSRIERHKQRTFLTRPLSDVKAFFRIIRRLTAYFRDERVEVVDARLSYAILFAVVAGRRARVPVVAATEYGQEFWRPPFRWCAGQVVLKLCDTIISDSQFRIDSYRRWLLFGHRQAVVIGNGIQELESSRTRGEMRRELGLPIDPSVRVVGQVSRLIPYKGHRHLIDAAAQVLARRQDVAFLICGFAHTPTYVAELRARAADLGITDRVSIVSYPGPIADVWQAIDVHVHASVYDSSPIAIHESMSLGLPAVVTGAGGIPELVADRVTGLVVTPGDPAALSAGLLEVLADDALAKRLGAAARARFESDHSAEVMAKRTHDLFRSILSSKRPRAISQLQLQRTTSRAGRRKEVAK